MIEDELSISDDFDSPWKDALELYFEAFMHFFFPPSAAEIDWSRGFEFLDKELQQVVREAEFGRKHADKLVKVWLKSGIEQWILIHVEFQGSSEREFPERMYVYNYRLYDRHRRPVVSLAVLTDESDTWRPTQFEYKMLGCEVRLIFPTIKLKDYWARWDELEKSISPFAVLVMAHLKTQETKGDYETRLISKITVLRMLKAKGYSLKDAQELFRLIDWMMILPHNLNQRFDEQWSVIEEKEKMPYITRYEKAGMEKGLVQGHVENARESVLEVLLEKFGAIPPEIIDKINALNDPKELKLLLRVAARAQSLAEFQAALQNVRS